MEADYTKRELDTHFGDIKGSLERIEKQVVKTNGRVGKLENWRWFLMGGMAIITFIVIPLVVYSFNQSVDNKVNQTRSK